MQTVVQTPVFIDWQQRVWSDAECTAFVSWIAANPQAGDVIRGSGGLRKVRFGRTGMGKRGGVRVIYFLEQDGSVWLLIVYAKAKFDNLSVDFLKRLKEALYE